MNTLPMENVLPIEMDTYEFTSDKDYKKFVNSCKKIIRGSYEYSGWVSYIKLTKGFSQCQFTGESLQEVSIDIHHHPYSMENIVKCMIETHMTKYQRVNTFNVSRDIMDLHYQNKIGYVLLIKSLHEKFHNGYLQIPMELVIGNYEEFEKTHNIPQEVFEIVGKYKIIHIKDVPKLSWNNDYIIFGDE